MKIWTVDAFTAKPFTGNPAAVTIVAQFPPDELCQNIAAEMNLSETAFVKKLGPDHFHIRWFTPEIEVKLCGHATLAAAHILYQNGKVDGKVITFDSLSGQLYVERQKDDIILNFPLQKTSEALPHHLFEKLFTPSSIVAAVKACDDVIVELNHEALVRQLRLDPALIKEIECRALIVTAKGSAPYDCVSRMYAPRLGINEDPVCGSAHCKLADYWQRKLGKSELLAYQASQRGGILGLRIDGDRVFLTGQAITIMEGEMKLNNLLSQDIAC